MGYTSEIQTEREVIAGPQTQWVTCTVPVPAGTHRAGPLVGEQRGHTGTTRH